MVQILRWSKKRSNQVLGLFIGSRSKSLIIGDQLGHGHVILMDCIDHWATVVILQASQVQSSLVPFSSLTLNLLLFFFSFSSFLSSSCSPNLSKDGKGEGDEEVKRENQLKQLRKQGEKLLYMIMKGNKLGPVHNCVFMHWGYSFFYDGIDTIL